MGDEDAFAFGGGETPAAVAFADAMGVGGGFVDRRVFLFGPGGGVVVGVVVEIPGEEEVVGAKEEGAGAAGGVEDAEFFDLFGGFAGDERAGGLADDVVHDVGGRVVDAAGFADLGLFLDLHLVGAVELDDLAEELFVDVAEDVGGDDGEGVGALGPVEGGEDFLEDGVVEIEGEGETVGGFVAALFGGEVEEARVVAEVGAFENLAQARVDARAGGEGLELAEGLDAAVLGDAQEDDAVEDALDGEVEFAFVEGVALGEVDGEELAPVFQVGEEVVVELGSAAFAAGGGGVFVEGTLEDGVFGEDGGDLVPAGGEFLEGAVEDAAGGGLVVGARADARVVDGELLEVGDDAERELGRPRVAAELGGGERVVFYADGRFFGLDEEFAVAADAKGVVGGGGLAVDLEHVLVDDVLVGLGVALEVKDIPAEGGRRAGRGIRGGARFPCSRRRRRTRGCGGRFPHVRRCWRGSAWFCG